MLELRPAKLDRYREIIVDTDASIEGRQALSLDGIKSQLTTLRAGIDVAFNAVVMPDALKAWKS